MPVKKRKGKRRSDEIEIWSDYFLFGFDMLWRLHMAGISEVTAAAKAEETWHRIGDQVIAYIEEHHPDRKFPIWALEEFGPPGEIQSSQRQK